MGIQNDGQDTYREIQFQLTYENEAVIPAEIGLTSYRVDNHDGGRNDEAI